MPEFSVNCIYRRCTECEAPVMIPWPTDWTFTLDSADAEGEPPYGTPHTAECAQAEAGLTPATVRVGPL